MAKTREAFCCRA